MEIKREISFDFLRRPRRCDRILKTQNLFWRIRLRLVRVKAFPEKYSIFRKCYFPERKMYSGVWLPWNSFYGKSILVFGSYKHFTENHFHFTENQFPCLVRSNILQKMEFVFYGKSILMFGLWIILQKITISSTCIT